MTLGPACVLPRWCTAFATAEQGQRVLGGASPHLGLVQSGLGTVLLEVGGGGGWHQRPGLRIRWHAGRRQPTVLPCFPPSKPKGSDIYGAAISSHFSLRATGEAGRWCLYLFYRSGRWSTEKGQGIFHKASARLLGWGQWRVVVDKSGLCLSLAGECVSMLRV